MYCKNCGSILDEATSQCSKCGVAVNREIIDLNITKNKSKKRRKTILASVFAVVAIFLIIFIVSGMSNSADYNAFVEEVDSMNENYRKYLLSDDRMSSDIAMKVACGDLWKVSQYYRQAKDKQKYDVYLDKNVTSSTFKHIYEYNSDGNGVGYTIEKDLVEYFRSRG